jgi:hypothetical protein
MNDEILRAIRLLSPQPGVVELRAITDQHIHSGYFDDLNLLVNAAETLDAIPDVQGIYLTLNDVDPALLSRRANRVKMKLGRKDATTADGDILRRRWFPIDIDPVRPSGVSSTDEEHQAAQVRAAEIAAFLGREHGWPAPVMADSGNGAHLLYRIDLPNDDESRDLVKRCLEVLDTIFSDCACTVDTANFNAARIWKMYGTTSRKGDHTEDRPHRKSLIVSGADQVDLVDKSVLSQLAALLPCAPPETKGYKNILDLRGWLVHHGLGIAHEKPYQGGTLYVLDECPFSGAHHDGAFAIQFPNGAIHAGCHHASCGGGSQRWQELRKRCEEPGKRREPKKPVASSPSPPPAPPPQRVATEHRQRASGILQHEDPLSFLLDTFHREHVGDRIVAECLIMSVASQSVANTRGLHVAISGNSGKGKTHACNTMLSLLPGEFRMKGTVSNKALYYHDQLRPGSVLLFDDVSLSDDLQEILKAATASFREPIEHRTVTTDRQMRVCSIPARCVWWLAKVESVGDDQVMNRTLTVWIDDSAGQDRAVLEHMKEREAQPPGDMDLDPDVPTCRAIWEVLKEQVVHVRIPFATRINFSATQNRRNPGMLFDLIKCHALLFIHQRERDEKGSLVATREDFAYARQLFLAITCESGGQETKQTRNESAALATIAKMGVEIFTIKQLQDALGLSYHQTYRLLHGYSNSRASYTGILDKCPAISFIDATVAEDLYGVSLKRREHYFSFDAELYRSWSARAQIWLDEEEHDRDDHDDDPENPDPSTFSPGFHQDRGESARKENDEIGVQSCNHQRSREMHVYDHGYLHTFQEPHSADLCETSEPACASTLPHGANDSVNLQNGSQWKNQWQESLPDPCTPECKPVQSPGKIPPTSGRATPIPGILDHREFTRTTVQIGRCDICDRAAAAYRCIEKQVNICTGCYARLVRGWNRENGIQ